MEKYNKLCYINEESLEGKKYPYGWDDVERGAPREEVDPRTGRPCA